MIWGTVDKQQDMLSGIFLGEGVEENFEAFRIGRGHDQIDASAAVWANSSVSVDVFANEL
jgi:hypothetical protein